MGNYNQLWNKHKVKVPFYFAFWWKSWVTHRKIRKTQFLVPTNPEFSYIVFRVFCVFRKTTS